MEEKGLDEGAVVAFKNLLRGDERQLDEPVVCGQIFVNGLAGGERIVSSQFLKLLMVLFFWLAWIGTEDFGGFLEKIETGGGVVHVLRSGENGLVINDFQDALGLFQRTAALDDL